MVRISDPREMVWAWSHKWTCSEKGIATHMFGFMHVSFLPKKHDITRALHGDMGSDVAVIWASGHDIIVKGI